MTPNDVFLAVYIALEALTLENRKKFLESFCYTLELQFPAEKHLIGIIKKELSA